MTKMNIRESIADFRERKSLTKQIITALFWVAFSILAVGVGTVAIGVIGSGVGSIVWIVVVDLLPAWTWMWMAAFTEPVVIVITTAVGWATIFLTVWFARSCGKFIDWMQKDDKVLDK